MQTPRSRRAHGPLLGLLVAVVASMSALAACAPPTPSPPDPAKVAPTTMKAPTTTTTKAPTTTTQAPTTTTQAPTTTSPTTTTQAPPAPVVQPAGAGAAASRIIFWTKCWDVVGLTDAQLATWQERGVGGFVCANSYLYAIGGAQKFTGDPASPLSGSAFDLQRAMHDSKIVSRAAAHGIKLWLGVGMSNYWNGSAPFGDWFDDATWTNSVVPQAAGLAGAARLLGFAGVAFDEELYAGKSGSAGTWDWNYPGNTHSESAVRAQARVRGAQLMSALVGAFPDVDVVDIHALLPEGWSALVQQEINDIPNAYQSLVGINFWDGMTSVPGYGAIRFMDHTYGKTSHLYKATWDTAFTYDLNRMSAMFSRNLSNWSYASSRIYWGPFAWINSGPRSFEASRSPQDVSAQLAAFRKWGTGGAFANYAYGGISTSFDYTPYVPGMQAAAAPGTVDSQPPVGTVGGLSRSGGLVTITGSATDNFGVRAVRWRTESGTSGAAAMTWTVVAGSYSTGYQWRMDWSASIPAASGQSVTLTFEDVKGLQTTKVVSAP